MPLLNRLILWAAVLPVLGWLIFVYPWQRLVFYLIEPKTIPLFVLFALWLLPVLCFYIWIKTRTTFAARLGQFSLNWMGISLMFMWAAALADIFLLSFSPERNVLAAIIIIGGTGLSCYAFYKASRVTTVIHKIESAKLNHCFKAVQLSDLHLGSRSLKFLSGVIEKTNRLQADIIFITGDLIDMSRVDPESLNVLNQLEAPAFFVTGNHDRYVGSDQHFNAIRDAGIERLDNQSVIYSDIQIIGIADENNQNQVREKLADITVDITKFTILLYHKPENFDFVKQQKIDLMLSGHTHGGQIFPFNLVVKKLFPNYKGFYKNGESILYVSQGTGTWGPVMRLGSANEITVFELRPKPR